MCHVGTLTVWSGEQGQRKNAPRIAVDPAVRENLTVIIELEFGLHQAIRELPRVDAKRADVASNLFVFLAWAAPEHHLENTFARFLGLAIDERDEMRREGERRLRRGHSGKERAGQVDSGTRTLHLTHFEVLDEECGDEVHANNLQIEKPQIAVRQTVHAAARRDAVTSLTSPSRTRASFIQVSALITHHP